MGVGLLYSLQYANESEGAAWTVVAQLEKGQALLGACSSMWTGWESDELISTANVWEVSLLRMLTPPQALGC